MKKEKRNWNTIMVAFIAGMLYEIWLGNKK